MPPVVRELLWSTKIHVELRSQHISKTNRSLIRGEKLINTGRLERRAGNLRAHQSEEPFRHNAHRGTGNNLRESHYCTGRAGKVDTDKLMTTEDFRPTRYHDLREFP